MALALLAIAAPAQGQGERGEFLLGLGTEEPGTATPVKFDVRYRNPDDPNGKPPSISGAEFRLPAGMRINTAAVPACTATDEQLRAQGTSACPAETRVGGGTLTAITGFGPPADPVAGEVTVFNGKNQLIEVVAAPGTDRVVGMDRLTVEGSTLTAHPPATPGGPPDGRTAIKDIRLTVDRAGYATTPPSCPADGRWRYGASFEFADGSKDQVAHTLACAARGGEGRSPRPAMKLTARPRKARAHRRTKFRFKVTSPARRCIRGAKVRFASKRARTNRRGRATITTTIHRARRLPMNVSKRGCRTARGTVRIVR
jgi:hypothetical protein